MEEHSDNPQPLTYEPPAIRDLGKLETVTGSVVGTELGPNVNPDVRKV